MSSGYQVWFLTALAVSLVLTPVMGRVARVLGVIDHPSKRRFHLLSTPLMGGVAITSTTVIVSIVASWVSESFDIRMAALLASGVIMMVLGLVDDIKDLSPKVKLIGQSIITVMLILSGVQVSISTFQPLNYALTFLWVVGIINCLNLLDNIDGLSGGTSSIAAIFLFLAGYFTSQPLVCLMAIIFAGSCLGFLSYNFHPASIFSGDAGSMFMGCMLAGISLLVMKPLDWPTHMTPPIILGLLIFDTGLVSYNRTRHGFKVTDGGKDHTSHRLCNMGLSIQYSVSTLFLFCIFFGAAGISILALKSSYANWIPAVVFPLMIFMGYLLKNYYDYAKHPGSPTKKKNDAPDKESAVL